MSSKRSADQLQGTPAQPTELLQELVAHLRQNRTQLREEWANRIAEARLLTAMTKDELFAEATSVYDNYVEARATFPSASFPEAWKPTKSWESCCCCATYWRGRCSPSIKAISRCSITSWTLMSRRPIALPTPWRSASCRNANASFVSSRKQSANFPHRYCRSASDC